MRLFIAGASLDIDRVRACIRAARMIGCAVADWTEGLTVGPDHRGDQDVSRRDRERAVVRNLKAISDADMLWLVAGSRSRGTSAEVVAALLRGVFCIASGTDDDINASIYTGVIADDMRFPADELALKFIRERMR